MKVSDFVANFLSKHTNKVFGGQGHSILHLVDSINKNKKISYIPGQSEQGSAIAADAYYRTTGKLGVCIATSGPGILNFLQGVASSYFDSIPSLYIAGAPTRGQLRKNSKIRQIGFQEMEVQKMVSPITKYSVLIDDPKKILYHLEKSIEVAFHKRMGPVLIEIPDDIQRMNMPEQKKFYKQKKRSETAKINHTVKYIQSRLSKSKKPLFIIGNGAVLSNSLSLIKKLIKNTNIPYINTWASYGYFNSNEKLNIGTIGVAGHRSANYAAQFSDLIIGFGVRLGPQIVGANFKKFNPQCEKILIDIDKNEEKSQILPLKSKVFDLDLGEILKSNLTKLKFLKNEEHEIWRENLLNLKNQFRSVIDKTHFNKDYVTPEIFFFKISNIINSNTILINDTSANLVWSFQNIIFNKINKIFGALNHSPMGYSLPACVGANIENKRKSTIAIIGDGSVPMNVQELETIKHFNLKCKIFIIDNDGLLLIKQTQETWLKKRYAGVDKKSNLSQPNFEWMAKSYNIKYLEIKNDKEISEKLKKIAKIKKPLIVVVKINPKSRVFPKLEFGKPLHEMTPKLNKYLKNKIEKGLKNNAPL